jgi:hypothetical protein
VSGDADSQLVLLEDGSGGQRSSDVVSQFRDARFGPVRGGEIAQFTEFGSDTC